MSQPPNTRSSSPAIGRNSLIAGDRLSVRLPSRTVPICVRAPMGFAMPLRTAMMPAMVVVLTAPRPTSSTPTLPLAGAMESPLVTGRNYIIRAMGPFRKGASPHQTAIAMIGAKSGSRVLVVGAGDAAVAGEVALVAGLNGHVLVVDRAT